VNWEAAKLAKMGIFVALAIALKLPILQIPNVEFFTFVVFASGYLFGILQGGVVGGLSILIYTTFNPYGFPPFPIALAQVISMISIGVIGGLILKTGVVILVKLTTFILMGFLGVILTLFYDLLTNLAVAYVAGQFIPVMLAAIPFSLVHIGSNAVIFVVFTPILPKLDQLEKRV
jgi:hypothetical protein